MATIQERGAKIFGEDVTKQPKLTKAIFDKVLAKHQEKRAELAEKTATELIEKLADLQMKAAEAQKKFNEVMRTIEKEANKVLGRIEGALAGVEPAPETTDDSKVDPPQG